MNYQNRVGKRVKLNKDAIENYGSEYANRVFTIEAVSTKYMPAKEFYAKGSPVGYHPGYDESAGGRPLYDLVGVEFSVYWWEITFG